MNTYSWVILGFVVGVANYYVAKWSFWAMTNNNDMTFLIGLLALILLAVTDYLILNRVISKELERRRTKQ